MTSQPSPPPNPDPKRGQRPDLTNPDEQQTLDPSFLLTSGSSSSQGDVPVADDSDLSFLSPPQSPEEIGRLSNYRVFRILGEGGMGMVLEAEDIKLKRRVAIKVMKPEIARKEQHRARFLREAQAAAAVEHDHIIPIYQIGEENGVPFIAMPFLKGEPLDAHLRNQQMEPAEVMLIGRQAAEGLAAAHAQGLIHRDIKPGNIWLESSTAHNGQIRVKILDFGLARLTSDVGQLTQSGAVLGTPAYMAPEQARGRPVDHRADIFSLGCVMYEMATGQRPFTGPDTMAVLSSLALDEPEAPLELNPELPPILSRLIMMMLQKDPAKRPPNATEVAGVLRKLQPENTVVVIARSTPVPAENPWSNIDASSSTNYVEEPSQVDETLSREIKPVSRDAKASHGGARSERDAASGGKSKKPLLIGAALGLITLIAVVIVIIRDKDGNKVAEIKVPKGGTVEVKDGSHTPDAGKKKDPLIDTPTNDFALVFDKKAKTTLPVPVDLSVPYTIEASITCDDKGGFPILSVNKFNLVGGPYWGFKSIGQKGTFGHTITSKIEWPIKAHVACVFDGKAMRLFINGKLAGATLVEADPPKKAITPLEMGHSFAGTIDEIRVSSVARYEKDFPPSARHASDEKTLALYHCDEGEGDVLKDSSGNGHHGKITGAQWVKLDGTAIPSPFGYALLYDGDSTVEVDSLSIPLTGDLTLEAFVTQTRRREPAGFSIFAGIIANINLYTASGGNCWGIGNGNQAKAAETPVVMNRRVHLAGVKHGKMLRLHVDGKMVGEKVMEMDILDKGQGKLFIGQKGFFGQLDEVRISKTARYTTDFTPTQRHVPDADTLALYHFDEGQGDILTDSSGNGHHGKIIGAKWVKAEGSPPSKMVPNYALGFAGNGRVNIPNLELTADGPRTYEAYARVPVGSKGLLLGRFRRTQLNIGGEKRNLQFSVSSQSGDSAIRGTEIPADREVHLAGVISGDEARIYMDGKLVGQTKLKDAQLLDSSGGWQIGDIIFVGQMREIRVSTAARYDKDFTPAARFEPDAKTLALFHCDEGEGDVLKDSSGNGHHGKIVGAKWVKADGTPIGALPPKVKNALGMEFALVPKGKSWLGGGDGKPGEKEVEFKDDFYLGTYEVTQEEWEKVMGANPSNYSRKGISRGAVTEISDDDLKRFPVETVSWDECQAFVAKVNEKAKETGWVYRLPTEAEWEYACRGGPLTDKAESAFSYYFDQPTNTLDETKVNAKHSRRTMKVGSYPPNRLGLFDMHGNVSEWCEDVVEDDNRVSRGSNYHPLSGKPYANGRLMNVASYQSGGFGLRLARVPVVEK